MNATLDKNKSHLKEFGACVSEDKVLVSAIGN